MPDFPILEFKDENRFLSNFFPVNIVLDEITYPTLEHAYQASKTDDVTKRQWMSEVPTPGQAKRLGKFLTLRPNWESIRVAVMADLIVRKFNPNDHTSLCFELMYTQPRILIEGNSWGDKFWGVSPVPPTAVPCPSAWGQNILGKLLMRRREELNLTWYGSVRSK